MNLLLILPDGCKAELPDILKMSFHLSKSCLPCGVQVILWQRLVKVAQIRIESILRVSEESSSQYAGINPKPIAFHPPVKTKEALKLPLLQVDWIIDLIISPS